MDEVVDNVVQIPVLEAQLVQLLVQRLDFFACQLVVDSRGSCRQSPRRSGASSQALTACIVETASAASITEVVSNGQSRMPPSRLTTSN